MFRVTPLGYRRFSEGGLPVHYCIFFRCACTRERSSSCPRFLHLSHSFECRGTSLSACPRPRFLQPPPWSLDLLRLDRRLLGRLGQALAALAASGLRLASLSPWPPDSPFSDSTLLRFRNPRHSSAHTTPLHLQLHAPVHTTPRAGDQLTWRACRSPSAPAPPP